MKQTTLILIVLLLLTGCGFRIDGTPPPVPTAPVPEIPTAPLPLIPTAPVPGDDAREGVEPVVETTEPVWTTAVAACAQTERNEVCQSGQTADLHAVHQVSWGHAPGDEPLLRLAADLDESEGSLTLLELGGGQIVELTTLVVDETAVAIPFATTDDETPAETTLADSVEPAPQQITFFSKPGTAESPSGLLLTAPSAALFTSVGLNGTQITLLGSAWAEAAAGGDLTLTILSGDVMMSVAGETAVATAGNKITVSLSPDGLAVGSPHLNDGERLPIAETLVELAGTVQAGDHAAENDDRLPIAEVVAEQMGTEGDEIVSIAETLAEYAESKSPQSPNWFRLKQTDFYYRKFLRSYQRCLSNRPDAAHYVYNTAYWLRNIENIGFIGEVLGDAVIARLQDMARQCATFDVDFGSTMSLSGSGVTFVAELKAEGVHVQFSPGGGPFQGDIQALEYRYLTVSGADVPGCTLEISHPDGTLRIDDGSLAIQENGLRVRLSFLPDVPQESFEYTCGASLRRHRACLTGSPCLWVCMPTFLVRTDLP